MHLERHRWLIGMLLLALTVLPGQSLYAQIMMLPVSSDSHACQTMDKPAGFEQAKQMKCCQQDKSECNQSCGDCFHCGSLIAVLSHSVASNGKGQFVYSPLASDKHTSQPSSGQFRPPRLII